ncbi:MAG: Nramp family divalent metal transporter [Planctomycetota bacterium]|nr:Nramp family divalent metal transporter [Planctomycetota bacterium]MDA1214654.1 Nramp family divalent metal transporter [Planctomycetota bacterium]
MSEPIYSPPPEILTRPSLRHILRYLGPGVIIASVTIGSGELVYASRSGAIFGYSLLWCFLYAGLFKAIQVYTAARHITLTGEHPMVAWVDLPGPRGWFPLLVAVPAVVLMPIAFSGIPEILGGFVHRLTGMSTSGPDIGPWNHLEFWINVWSGSLLTVCLILALGSSYQVLERVSTVVLAAIVLCVGVSVVVFWPDMWSLLSGLFVPRTPVYPEWLTSSDRYAHEFRDRSPWLEISIYLGAVGGGAYDYIGYIGMLREKKWGLAGREPVSRRQLDDAVAQDNPASATTIARGRQWERAPLYDTTASFFFVILVTLLFAVLAALVLHSDHAVPANNDLLNEQETFLSKLHPELRWVYRIGVFLAFIGTLYGAFDVYRHTFVESARAIAPKYSTPARRPWMRRGIVAYCFIGGLTMIWLPENVAGTIIKRMTFGSIISGATTCGLWCFVMLWTDHVRLPPPLRMSRTLKTLTFVSGLVMTTLGVIITIEYFGG